MLATAAGSSERVRDPGDPGDNLTLTRPRVTVPSEAFEAGIGVSRAEAGYRLSMFISRRVAGFEGTACRAKSVG